jgi:hypothetical protein
MHARAAAFLVPTNDAYFPSDTPFSPTNRRSCPHETFVGFAQMRGITAFTDLVGHDAASLPCRLQVPGVIAGA